MYSYKKIDSRYIVSIDNHTEIVKALNAFCKEKGIRSGSINGIGAIGELTLRVEGTLYWKSRAIYSGELAWEGRTKGSIPVKARYFNQAQANEDMITELKTYHIKE